MSKKDKERLDELKFEAMLDQYFQEKMNPAEEAGFKSLLNKNPHLKENFELEKDLRLIGDMKQNPAKYQENQDILKTILMLDAIAKNHS